MLKIKENKEYKINSFNVRSIIILSTFAILLLYLSNTFLFENINQVWADSVIDTIPVGSNPFGVAYDSGDGRVYVANAVSNTVSVIDTSTNTVNANITVGSNPVGVAYDPDDGMVYVTKPDSSSVSVIDTKTNTVIGTISVGTHAYGVAYDSGDGRVYVTNLGSNTVSVIDTSTNTVNATTITVGTQPIGVAYDSGDGRVYVTNVGSNTVSVIATSQYPHHTTITSAVDGNNKHVQNGSSTLSTSITFNVRAIPGVNPITGFQCSLDNSPSFSPCGTAATNNVGTITFSNLAAGQQHTIKIRAVDSQNNVDLTPATFRWTVVQQQQPPPLTHVQEIQQKIRNLLSEIDSIPNLSTFTKSSLEAPLKVTITLLNNNNNHQTLAAACFTMKAFLQIVNINENAGHLSYQQSAELKQQAINIQKAMGCFSQYPFQFSNGGGGDDNDNDNDRRINNNNVIKPFNDDEWIDSGR